MCLVILLGTVVFLIGSGLAYGTGHGALGASPELTARIARQSPRWTGIAVVGLVVFAVFVPDWPSRITCVLGAVLLTAGLRSVIRSWRRGVLLAVGYSAAVVGMILFYGPLISAAQEA